MQTEIKYVACTECGKEMEAHYFLTECDYCLSKKEA
jgi:DNA-directed RNA polymerase subunit RPC12/RpoP